MPIFAESESKIFGDLLYDVVNNTNVTRTSPGSKTRALAQAVSKKLGRQWKTFDKNVALGFIDGSNGKYLDFIGQMLGLPRAGETTASISSADRLVRFYVDIGTFGTINSGSSIILPAGTLVGTSTAGTGIVYRVPFQTLLPSGSSESYVAVEALRPGTTSNLGAGQLRFHNFSDYTDSLNGSLKVNNEGEINVGREIEGDTNYRFRLSNQVIAAETANLTAIRLTALSVPGVADVAIIPYFHGIGSFDVLIKATVPSVSVSLEQAVWEAIFKKTGFGNVATVRGPLEIGVSMIGELTLKRRITVDEQDSLVDSVTANITSYIDNLDIGEDLIFNEMIERVMATSDLIKNVGSTSKPFQKVYIHRPSKLEDNKVRSTLVDDFSPEADEKLLVENQYAGSTPILFRVVL